MILYNNMLDKLEGEEGFTEELDNLLFHTYRR